MNKNPKAAPSALAQRNAINAYKKQALVYVGRNDAGFDELTMRLAEGTSRYFSSAPVAEVIDWAIEQGWPRSMSGLGQLLQWANKNPRPGDLGPLEEKLVAIGRDAVLRGVGTPWDIETVELALGERISRYYSDQKQSLSVEKRQELQTWAKKGWIQTVEDPDSTNIYLWQFRQELADLLGSENQHLAGQPSAAAARSMVEEKIESSERDLSSHGCFGTIELPDIVINALPQEERQRLDHIRALAAMSLEREIKLPDKPEFIPDIDDKARFAAAVPMLVARYFIDLEELLDADQPITVEAIRSTDDAYLDRLEKTLAAFPSNGAGRQDADDVHPFYGQLFSHARQDEYNRPAYIYLLADSVIDRQRAIIHHQLPPSEKGWDRRHQKQIMEGLPLSIGHIARAMCDEIVAEHHIGRLEQKAVSMSKKQTALKEIPQTHEVPVVKSKLPWRLSEAIKADDISHETIQETADALQLILDSRFISRVEKWAGQVPAPPPMDTGWPHRGDDARHKAGQRVELLSRIAQSARLFERAGGPRITDVISSGKRKKPSC